MYFLLNSGSREEYAKIFEIFESINNAGGNNAEYTEIYQRTNGVTQDHSDKGFIGWRLTINGTSFVFLWNGSAEDFDLKGKAANSDKEHAQNNDVSSKAA